LNRERDRIKIVISESDIDAALEHLRSLSYRPFEPESWERSALLLEVKKQISSHLKCGGGFYVAPGVYAIVNYFGIDLIGSPAGSNDVPWQVFLLIRNHHTDLNRMTVLNIGDAA
jgi:hypothetical protein